VDPLALWGAITGTVAVAIAGRREFISNRARLGIEHGIWYLFGNDPPNLNDAWLLVRVWNDGGQPLTVERVGLDLLPIVVDAERGLIVLGTEGQHVEIELRGESVELRPGGPSHRFYAPLRGLVQARVEMLDSAATAWAKASDGKEWRGDPTPIVPRRVHPALRADVERAQEGMNWKDTGPKHVSLPNDGPPTQGSVLYG
jgi:hypothetical protein